jgi:quinol monooxygenase YgiN
LAGARGSSATSARAWTAVNSTLAASVIHRPVRSAETLGDQQPGLLSRISWRVGQRQAGQQADLALDPANLALEVQHGEPTGSALRTQDGVISFDMMTPDEETVVVTQLWTSRQSFFDGMSGMREAVGQLPPSIVNTRETYSGEVAVSMC